jgi:hypothetical protein
VIQEVLNPAILKEHKIQPSQQARQTPQGEHVGWNTRISEKLQLYTFGNFNSVRILRPFSTFQ